MAWSLPTLQHLIPAEEFTWDPVARVFSLRNVLTVRPAPPGRLNLPRLDVIAVLSGGRGVFDFVLEVARVHDGVQLVSAGSVAQQLPDAAGIYHLPFYFENVPLDAPGQYEVRLFARSVADRTVTELPHTAVVILEETL